MPGPGSKRVKPNGLVAAASMTSQMSIPMRSASDRHLVDQRDVDGAEDVLEQLRELGDLGGGDRHDVVADAPVELDGAVGARRREAADDLRRVAQRVVGAAGVDALGREGEVEVLAGAQAGLLEQRNEVFPRRAGEGRRLEHDELTLRDHAGQRARGVQQRAEVGLAVARQRGRDADEDRLRLVQLDEPRREHAAVQDRAEALLRDVLDVRPAVAQRGDLGLVDVDADHVDAGLGEADGQRQPDVAHPDDPDAHGPKR